MPNVREMFEVVVNVCFGRTLKVSPCTAAGRSARIKYSNVKKTRKFCSILGPLLWNSCGPKITIPVHNESVDDEKVVSCHEQAGQLFSSMQSSRGRLASDSDYFADILTRAPLNNKLNVYETNPMQSKHICMEKNNNQVRHLTISKPPLMYPDDFGVENDNCHPSHFFCSLFWEDPDVSELYLRRQFRHLVLVTSSGKQNIAALSFYTAGRGIDNQHFHFCNFKNLVLLAPSSGRCSLLFSNKDSNVPKTKIKQRFFRNPGLSII